LNSVSGNLNVTGNVIANATVIANVIIANTIITTGNANVSGNVNATYFVGDGSRLTGIVLPTGTLNSVTGNLNVTGNVIANATVIANAFITTGNVNAGNVNVNRISSNIWTGLYTANIIESSSNLFYTNTRVYSNIIQLLPTLAGQNITIEANGQIRANIITALIAGNLNVVGNIISNATVIANAFITTGNVNAANIIVDRLFANVISVAGNVIGNLTVLSNIIANGLIINGTEIVTGGTNEVTIRAANITANIITANIWNGIYTSNVRESGANIYFTNTRAIAAFSAGSGINLYANGLIEGGVLSLSDSQYFTSASFVYATGASTTNVSLSTSVTDSRRIIVSIDGLVQAPTLDYYVNGTALAFNSNISINSVIEVKYFGNEAISALSFNPFLFASL
jgi:hypothetical protein